MTDRVHTPRVSIGLPVYNGERYLQASIRSILDQNFDDLELIISDDASTDSTPEICRRFAEGDARVRYIRQPVNIGLAGSFNFVIAQARGELFKWTTHDNVCDPALLERCCAALDARPDAALAYTLIRVIDQHDREIEGFVRRPPALHGRTPAERFRELTALFVDDNGRSVEMFQYGLIRTAALRRTRGMPPYLFGDLNLCAELALEGAFVEVPEQLLTIREVVGSASHASPERLRTIYDPNASLRLPWALYTRRKFFEYGRSILRGPLGPLDKLQLMAFAATLPLRRLWVRYRVGVDDYAQRLPSD